MYWYYEGAKQSSITTVSPHFSEFLLAVIEADARVLEEIARLHPQEAKQDPDFARRVADWHYDLWRIEEEDVDA